MFTFGDSRLHIRPKQNATHTNAQQPQCGGRNERTAAKMLRVNERVKCDCAAHTCLFRTSSFRTNRKWYSQFYADVKNVAAIQGEVNGVHHTLEMDIPANAGHDIDEGLPF
mgnify:CR=1 FL=1